MANLLNYDTYTFDDLSIVGGNSRLANSLLFDALEYDTLTVDVLSNETGPGKLYTKYKEWFHTVDGRGYVVGGNDIRKFRAGAECMYFYDGKLVGKYYIESVERIDQNVFRLQFMSVVGMWVAIPHMGGIYTGETVGTVLASMLNGYSYTIDPSVASVQIYGYLPIASIRDNLQQILFAVGASLVKNEDGDPHFMFMDNLTPITIDDGRIYEGASLEYTAQKTLIKVTEHAYYKSSLDTDVSLFDNTDGSGAVNNKLVTFENPCYGLKWNGSDVTWEHGENYCYVTGIGVLSGKQYTHTTKIFEIPTGVDGDGTIAEIKEATLISGANSANVAARVADYYKSAESVSCGIVLETDDVKPGKLISFNDPYGEESEGIIAQMDITISAALRADCTVVKNYIPSHFGNNFTQFDLLTFDTPSGTYTAKKTGMISVVIAQGGQAGQGGQGGGNATCSSAGAGGSAGQGGAPGKVFVVNLNVTQGQTFSYTIGDQGMGSAGGAGGGEMGSDGEEGGHSTFGSYTSADGAIPPNGYINILTGDLYSEYGLPGVDGGNGGVREAGKDVTFDGNVWTGGWAMGSGNARAGGGGAAYGANGHMAHTSSYNYYIGGDGADAEQLEIDATPGSGGRGGCGGGGGGTGGLDGSICWSGASGDGGNGSAGYYGGFGYIIVYY